MPTAHFCSVDRVLGSPFFVVICCASLYFISLLYDHFVLEFGTSGIKFINWDIDYEELMILGIC